MKLVEYIKKNRNNFSNTNRNRAMPIRWQKVLDLLPNTPAGIAEQLGEDQLIIEGVMQRMRKKGLIERINYWQVKSKGLNTKDVK